MTSRPLFLLLDSVHMLECIRNNCISQKDVSKFIMLPIFYHNGNQELVIQNALFCTLKELHVLESQSILKYCYKLLSYT